jgi:hypothetical protein
MKKATAEVHSLAYNYLLLCYFNSLICSKRRFCGDTGQVSKCDIDDINSIITITNEQQCRPLITKLSNFADLSDLANTSITVIIIDDTI